MSGRVISRRSALLTTVGLALVPAAAKAQDDAAHFPSHPIRVIVSVPAGGGVDTFTRLVTAGMQAALGQPLPVENKAGVGGSLASEIVATCPIRAAPAAYPAGEGVYVAF